MLVAHQCPQQVVAMYRHEECTMRETVPQALKEVVHHSSSSDTSIHTTATIRR